MNNHAKLKKTVRDWQYYYVKVTGSILLFVEFNENVIISMQIENWCDMGGFMMSVRCGAWFGGRRGCLQCS